MTWGLIQYMVLFRQYRIPNVGINRSDNRLEGCFFYLQDDISVLNQGTDFDLAICIIDCRLRSALYSLLHLIFK